MVTPRVDTIPRDVETANPLSLLLIVWGWWRERHPGSIEQLSFPFET